MSSLFEKIKNIIKYGSLDNEKKSKTDEENIQFDFMKDLPFEVQTICNIEQYNKNELYKYSKRVADKIKDNPRELYDCIIDEIIHQNKCWNKKITNNREKIRESIVIKKVDILFESNANNVTRDIYVYTQPLYYLLPPDMENKEEDYGYILVYFNNDEFKNGSASAEWDI